MILYELIKFEEQLLMCEAKNKFEMPFFDYVILNNLLTETEKITNLYFQIINDFKQEKCQEGDNGEKIDRLSKFNNKILNEEIEFNFKPYDKFIKKYGFIK